MSFIDGIKERAKQDIKTIVLPESEDERTLRAAAKILEEKTAVCEEVATQMVQGACEALNTDYAISATGYAGPSAGDTNGIPVGTIWIACGSKNKVTTLKLDEDFGRVTNHKNGRQEIGGRNLIGKWI